MANKFYTVTKTINGKEYTAQFSGLSTALEMIDNSYIEGTNSVSVVELGKYVFAHGIVSPSGLSANDFDNLDEYNEVVAFGRGVMQGKIKPEVEDDTKVKKATADK